MIKISKLTDYAFVSLLALARKDGESVSASELSAETAVPEPTMAKILKTLGRYGIVTSRRGPNGGYSLARAPEGLSVGEVIEAFEGPIALTACVEHSAESCALEGVCELSGRWSPLNRQIRDVFYKTTLSDMMRHNPCGGSAKSLLNSKHSNPYSERQMT